MTVPKGERALVARARLCFTRLAGMEFGDKLADELWESRSARYSDSDTRPKDGDKGTLGSTGE